MALLPIITAPDPRLKIKARRVPVVDDAVRRLMDDMLETMYHSIGIGLAAPQVGVAQRVLVVDCARDGEKPQPMRLANPEILWRSEALMVANEGCLSLPEHYAEVERPDEIRLRYLAHGPPRALPAARDRPSRRGAVRRRHLGAEARHHLAQTGHDQAQPRPRG